MRLRKIDIVELKLNNVLTNILENIATLTSDFEMTYDLEIGFFVCLIGFGAGVFIIFSDSSSFICMWDIGLC